MVVVGVVESWLVGRFAVLFYYGKQEGLRGFWFGGFCEINNLKLWFEINDDE
jgi:hypothetical protein